MSRVNIEAKNIKMWIPVQVEDKMTVHQTDIQSAYMGLMQAITELMRDLDAYKGFIQTITELKKEKDALAARVQALESANQPITPSK